MRKAHRITRSLPLLVLLAGCVSGCSNEAGNCERTLECAHYLPQGSSGSGGVVVPVDCIPSENVQPVADTCGVFVSSTLGKDGAEGSKSTPLKSLQEALAKAQGRPVYACAEGFTGSVALAGGSSLYGGLDCANGWAYVGKAKKSALSGDADTPALTLGKDASGAEVADFAITSPNAMAPGASSIAVLVDQATASFTRCDLVAGNGADGADGEDAPSMAAAAGATGNNGADACSADEVNGGKQVTNMCGAEISVGGSGGNGTVTNGGSGDPGQPGNAGKGGDGQPAGSGSWDCNVNGAGQGGQAGEAGTPGPGAAMTDVGTLSATGFTPTSGSDGTSGKIGQGGGGGGGAKGGTVECTGKPGPGGASGGSGGAGGCGGAGGKGGKGGGASIALVSLKAQITLTEVSLTAGNGGKGGAGGDSQPGGTGGLGGTGGANLGSPDLKAGCKGGDGGTGGSGGPGGGGRGGHAIGLAYTGVAPTIDAERTKVGTAGTGGLGGNKGLKNNGGADGISGPIYEIVQQ